MVGNNNKFLTGGFTMKQICKIYSSTISFIRAFERAAGVVVLSATLMFNCATTKSADTSSGYVAESSVKSESPNDRIEKLERVKKDLIELKGLIEKHQELTEIEEQASLKEEQACKGMYNALMEMKELCKKGDMENCEEYKKDAPIYEKECGGK
jgi:hypothetical protein